MYITQEADYAIRIIHCLAKDGGRRDARSISREVYVTLRFSLKILGKLSSAGLVQSFKGNRGGYELAQPPANITLQDVLQAVEGPFAISRCLNEGECSCGAHGVCVFQKELSKISQDVNNQLAEITFQALMEKEKAQALQQAPVT